MYITVVLGLFSRKIFVLNFIDVSVTEYIVRNIM